MRNQNCQDFTGEDIPFLKDPMKLDFALKCKIAVQEHAPDLLQELDGVLEGGGFDFNTLGVLELSLSAQAGCTLFAISGERTSNGNPILARSYDFEDWSISDFTGTWTSPDQKFASLGFTDIGIGRYGGANECGLAVATTMTNPIDTAPGVINCLALRWILDTFQTTGETIDFLMEIPHVWGVNFLIIDRENEIAVVETHPKKTVKISHTNGFAAVTNHYISPNMSSYQSRVHPSSLSRLEYMNDWFENRTGKISIDDVKNVQRNHEAGICVHHSNERVTFQTCWAWIAQSADRIIHVCQGSPCENEYEMHSY
jgi:predicted choloylglycine hydrolase